VIKVVGNLRQVGVFFPGSPFSSTNKSDCHNITEILLKVALNTINHKNQSYARQLSILTNRTTTLSKFGMYVADWLVETMTLTRPYMVGVLQKKPNHRNMKRNFKQ
jgi:hypothetical protein